MSESQTGILSCLIDLEALMRSGGMWSSEFPPDDAFASQMPFFVDRMNFLQWLQFVFIPTLRDRIEAGEPLPPECAIAPMAEIHFREAGIEAPRLLELLVQIDRQVTEAGQA